MADYKEVTPVGPGLRGIPRLNPNDGFAEYEGGFDITNMDYLASCFFMGIVGYVLFLLAIVFFFLLILFKILRKLFCCCPAKPPKPPSDKTVMVTNIIALIFSCICALGCFLVFSGSPQVVDGAAGVTGALLDGVSPLSDDLGFIGEQMNIATDNDVDMSEMATSLGDLQTSLDDILAQVDDVDQSIEGNIGMVNQMFLGFAVIYLIFCILGGLAGWKKLGKTLYFLFFLAFFLLLMAWILFGLSMTISQLCFDLCDSIDQYLEDPATSDLSALLPCMDPEAAAELEAGQKAGIDEAMEPLPVCISQCEDGQITLKDDDWFTQLQAADSEFRIETIKEMTDNGMPEEDAITQFEELTAGMQKPATAAMALYRAIGPTVDLAACTFVTNVFTFISDDACTPLKAGLDLLYPGLCLIGIGFNAMWIIYLVWAKRASAKPAEASVEMY